MTQVSIVRTMSAGGPYRGGAPADDQVIRTVVLEQRGPMELAARLSLMSFEQACRAVVSTLKRTIPLASWAVTRHDGDRQVFVAVEDDVYGAVAGDSRAWADSFCRSMVAGETPPIAPDVSAVPEYAARALALGLVVGTYAGAPVRAADGSVVGSLYGQDPMVGADDLLRHAPLLELLAALLGQVLQGDQREAEARHGAADLCWRATHDPLTGLPNRVLFSQRVQHALAVRRRQRHPLGVLLLDVDGVTVVDGPDGPVVDAPVVDGPVVDGADGHATAERVHAEVARRVAGTLRAGDTLARLDHDAFAVLIEDGGDPHAAAGRVLDCLRAPVEAHGASVTVHCSVGVVELPVDHPPTDVDAVLARPDAARYSDEHAVESPVGVHDLLPADPALRLLGALRWAIAAGDVELHYQAIVELGEPDVRSFESLARWRLGGRWVPPEVFVPLAARSGLLPALTAHLMDTACAQLARWSADPGHPGTRVGVNVSPDSLTDPAFPDLVAGCLARHGVRADQLVLEITEDALLTDLDAAAVVTARLQALGTPLSLDDFGTGYSSLRHLRHIPLATFKIDRSFTRDLDTDPGAERFVAALLQLGRDLGMEVVVEGVERPGQLAVLRRLGCRYAQGWLLARAVPAADVRWTADLDVDAHDRPTRLDCTSVC
ncbi:EAL domain-containing protein [Modestobacter sp. CPCC 205119]|uniref:EAL domain-containing protein n=2 Tax=Goekera deserti TaxID=2497753 RepID=A0A7K3WF83_9ACTN|nr:EAL domain-containing protein [Goekera deserti]